MDDREHTMEGTYMQQNPLDLHTDIERIDKEIHTLLMERSATLSRSLATRQQEASASYGTTRVTLFNPAQEAELISALIARHHGPLPIKAVENIWRILISASTSMEASYTLHADSSEAEGIMRDCVRFHFGFTVPYVSHKSLFSVLEAVTNSAHDLGIFATDRHKTTGAWWHMLTKPEAPKIISRLPFLPHFDHLGKSEMFVISRPLGHCAARDRIVYALSLTHLEENFIEELSHLKAEIVARVSDQEGHSFLAAFPGTLAQKDIFELLEKQSRRSRKLAYHSLAEIGSYAIHQDKSV